MTLDEKRQLSDKDKKIILERYGKKCYATDHVIDSEKIEFHHLEPWSKSGPTVLSNIVPACADHHRTIGTLSIHEWRDKVEMQNFFGQLNRRLNDVLQLKIKEFGQKVSYKVKAESPTMIQITFFDGTSVSAPLYEDPTTSWKFFYSLIPAFSIRNDTDLQPRPLEPKRMWELYQHLRTNTQLAASVCRLTNSEILLFDGQHKAAAQIWLGRKTIECKVYLEPEPQELMRTNLAAHHALRQMPFYTSTLMNKFGVLYKNDWDEYFEQDGRKSENGFVKFLQSKGRKRSEIIEELRSAIMGDILESQDPPCKIVQFIEPGNRPRDKPLTHHIMRLTIFHDFLTAPPLDIEFESKDDFRRSEKKNLVRLLNVLAEESVLGKWNPQSNDSQHKKIRRFYLAGPIRAWIPMLKDAISARLNILESEEKERIFFREITEDQFELIRSTFKRLLSHPIWSDPSNEIDDRLKVNQPSIIKKFLKEKGLDVAWLLGVES